MVVDGAGLAAPCGLLSARSALHLAFVLVPEAGIEPARLAARDFLATSAFAASACAVRGLEHAFTIALQP